MSAHSRVSLRALLLTVIVAGGLIVSPAFAAELGITVHQVDTTQFPRVRVSVSVAESHSIPIANLDRQAFQLLEDDQPVSNLRVEPIVDSQEPVAVAVAIDTSRKMAQSGRLEAAKTAASGFIDGLGPRDPAAVVSFGDEVRVVQDYTQDRAALRAAIAGLAPAGDAALFDAVVRAAQLQRDRPERRRVMVLMTDGDDVKSRQTLESSTASAQSVGLIVFAIGVGPDVNRTVLDSLTGVPGQAVYGSTSEELRQIFGSIGDRLRRQYVLEYTSQARRDDRQHGLLIKAEYRGQAADVRTSFTVASAPLTLDVRGVASGSRISGVQQVEVATASGELRQVEFIVDDVSRAVVTSAPFAFRWDTQADAPGQHKLLIRATDAGGDAVDREITVEVAPAPVVVQTPVVQPQAPTPVPAASTALVREDQMGYVVGGIALLVLLLGALAVFLIAKNTAPKKVLAPAPAQGPSDKTEFIAHGALVDATIMGARRPPALLPKAKLVIGPGREISLPTTSGVTIGRDSKSTVVLDDVQASRNHARIIFENDGFWIEDLQSTNGTRVNGGPVTRQRLQSKDQIGVGDSVLTFLTEQPGSSEHA